MSRTAHQHSSGEGTLKRKSCSMKFKKVESESEDTECRVSVTKLQISRFSCPNSRKSGERGLKGEPRLLNLAISSTERTAFDVLLRNRLGNKQGYTMKRLGFVFHRSPRLFEEGISLWLGAQRGSETSKLLPLLPSPFSRSR